MNPAAHSSNEQETSLSTRRVRLAEIFQSIQGEGSLTGTPSVFIRTTGCNLRCWFCDTPYTSWSAEGKQVSVADLLARVLDHDCEHIVVTGGEPLLQPAIVPLIGGLRDAGKHVTVETAATVYRPVAADLFSISPKLSNSTPGIERSVKWNVLHERWRKNPEVVRSMLSATNCQLKFVIDQPGDLEEVLEYLKEFPEVRRDQVWLMPQTTDQESHAIKKEWLEPLALQHGFHFSPRLHIEKWGNTRGR